MKILVSYSGGKDSQACLINAIKEYGADKVTAVFCDTGWEHPDTYTHIRRTTEALSVNLVTLKSKYDFVSLAVWKKRFPSPNARFCTSELKMKPMIDYILALKESCIIIQGIRAGESNARAKMLPECMYFQSYFQPNKRGKKESYRAKEVREWCRHYDASVLRPIFTWTARQVIDCILSAGQKPNPLYYRGFTRVGCFPCIMCRKIEILRLMHDKPMVERLLRAEQTLKQNNSRGSTFFRAGYIPAWACSDRKSPTIQDVFRYVSGKNAISQTHIALQSNAIKAINRNLTLRNWLIGFYIVEFEQKGEDRAQYGTNLLKTLEKQVNTRGLTETLFKLSRQFYITYPQIKDIITDQLNAISAALSQDSVISSIRAALSHKLQSLSAPSPICPTLSDELQSVGNQTLTFPPERLIAHLSFSHIAELLPIADPIKRLFYETEAIKCNWSVRELRRQIATQLYERCGMSLNPSKLIVALQNNNPQPIDIIKHPFTFEFLGLKAKDTVEETDLEQALIDHLQEFLLELGYGFCFEARQKRIIIDDRYYFADLVFYHRILHCHVIIELKNDEFRHEHLGQLNAYVSYYRDTQMAPGDNPPIGILLCTGAGPKMVEYATASLDTQLFVSKYLIELPQPQQLAEFIQHEIKTLKK